MSKEKNAINYIVFIRVISAVSVLILHTNGCFWSFSSTARYWRTANIIECIFYFAVPLFFMIIGVTLFDFYERYTLKEYFIKRLRKSVIPFVAWNLIGLAEGIVLNRITINSVNLKYIYQGITGTSIIGIYWFFTSLFIIYLSLPLFASVEKTKRKEVFLYLVISGFVLNQFIPFLKNAFSSDLNTPYSITVVSGALIWPPLGWLLHNCELKNRHKILVYILAICGLIMHIEGTYILSIREGQIISTFKGYQNVPCVLYSVGIFILLKDIGNAIMHGNIERFVKWIGSYTFPIYMMQFILLDLFPHLPFVNTYSIIYRLGAPFIMIPIIIAITWVMRTIPIIRRIVP